MSTQVREVDRVVTAHKQREGGGFIVRRPVPSLGAVSYTHLTLPTTERV